MKSTILILTLLALSLVGTAAHASQRVAEGVFLEQKQDTTPIVEISVVDNIIKVKNVEAGSKLEIYNVVGVKVKEIDMKFPSGDYSVNIDKGYYIVRINDTVRKIIIR
jgi:hypothetical protein